MVLLSARFSFLQQEIRVDVLIPFFLRSNLRQSKFGSISTGLQHGFAFFFLCFCYRLTFFPSFRNSESDVDRVLELF